MYGLPGLLKKVLKTELFDRFGDNRRSKSGIRHGNRITGSEAEEGAEAEGEEGAETQDSGRKEGR